MVCIGLRPVTRASNMGVRKATLTSLPQGTAQSHDSSAPVPPSAAAALDCIHSPAVLALPLPAFGSHVAWQTSIRVYVIFAIQLLRISPSFALKPAHAMILAVLRQQPGVPSTG